MKNQSLNLTLKEFSSLFFVLLLLSFSSCGIFNKEIEEIKEVLIGTANSTTAILDQAVSDLNGNAENYGNIMQEAIDKIDDQNVKNQLSNARDDANKIVATAGTEFKCSIQFTADFLKKKIKAIKADLLNRPIPKELPVFCQIIPASIDMNRPANQRNEICLTGYFLKEDFSKYKLYHYASNGNKTDKTISLTVSTDFKLIINLGSSGITINENSAKLSLTYDGEMISEIPIIQRQREPCKIQERAITGISNLVIYPDHKKSPWQSIGDKEFKGHGPCTKGSVSIFTRNSGRELWARAFVQMWECPDKLDRIQKDYTYGSKEVTVKLKSIADGWRIKKIKDNTYANFQNIDKNHNTELVPGSGPISSYIILGDTGGSDLGRSYVEFRFKAISVTLEEFDDCISN